LFAYQDFAIAAEARGRIGRLRIAACFRTENGYAGRLAHCRYFACYYEEKANQAKSLASNYEELAKSVGSHNQLQPEREKQ
jgi:hypothetical protein